MVEIEGAFWLVLGDELLEWTLAGYRQRRPLPRAGEVRVMTPAATVRTLAAGFLPALHPSAGR